MKIEDILARAKAEHRLGRFALAEQGYLDVIRKQPNNFEALSLLGTLELQTNRAASAVQHLFKALKVNPKSPTVYSNHALALQALRRYDEALAACDRALTLKPDYSAAIYNRALILQDMKRYVEALAGYERVLAMEPAHPKALHNRGAVLQELGRMPEALESCDRALALDPQNAEVHNNRGTVLRHMQRFEDALAAFDRALILQSSYAVAHYNRGMVLQDLKRNGEALDSYTRAIQIKPDYAVAFNNRGLLLRDMRRHDEALVDVDRALLIEPNYVEALNNRGAILQELRRHDEALATFSRMLELQGNNAKGYNNRGHALRGLGRYAEAVASYDKAVELEPGYAEAHFNGSLSRLLLGDLERGWREYEWRWHGRTKRDFTQPLWLGDASLSGKTILLHAEQGFGDTLQIARFVPMVADLGARVVLEVQPPLASLMEQFASHPNVATVMKAGDPLPAFDFHCPLMSLPLAFKIHSVDAIPRSARYLEADSTRVRHWANKLGQKRRSRVGLVWSGSGEYANDYNRSILLADIDPILALPFEFVSLQKEIRDHDKAALEARPSILHFGDDLQSFADTAGLAENLDLVISVDTAVAHLSAALGLQTWVMLKAEPDWRWLLNRSDSVWYPTATLFRQTNPGHWGDVIDAVARTLKAFPQS